MHIWYVHHYGGGPGVGLYDRPYELARAWQRQGHTVTVFVAQFHHLLEKRTQLADDFLVDGVQYVSVPARGYDGNTVSRLFNIWDLTKNLYLSADRYGRDWQRPDAVIASSPHPFTIYPAARIARSMGAKLVFEIRDIWPLSITEILKTSRLHPFVQLCAMTERFALTRSDLVASVLPRADRYLQDRGYGHKPFVWVPNGTNIQRNASPLTTENARKADAVLDQWKAEGLTTVVHAGSLGKPNAVDLLLEAVAFGASRGETDRCGVLLLGSGEQLSKLQEQVSQHNLKNVFFAGRVAKNEVSGLLEKSDIGYAGVRALDRLYQYGVSLNKFADYYGASLPALLPIEPCGDPVSASGGGIARRAQTPEAIWSALHELVVMPSDTRRALGAKGRAYMAREYDYDLVARRYVEAIATLS
ncbi:glycosyltransferase family 4 protein [Hyphomicrobium sp.]|uniref:glycosyltransferase family 4 protein n=1 Tax=Hyphomicrobium sp. TaxID=82 RepID=UPI002E2F34FF|nr:glycosyltransferase family 4 protein [Hyphomicrobium sp.]HEX2839810.1 glycosyltransferase family 4 protein [Hyphomicrobium sp.]